MSQKKHFLVADDDPLNLDIIVEYLSLLSSNFTVESAENGLDAWQLLSDNVKSHFDIVILDNMMPKMSGIDVLRKMQADKELKNTPVIIQSARARKEDVIEGIEAGAFYYLTKPFNEEQFANVMQNCIRSRNIYKNLQETLAESMSSMRLLEEATFNFKTLDDVHAIATLIASACPQSDRSLSGLFELMLNAIEHGNLGIGYDEKSELNKSGEWENELKRRAALEDYKDKIAQIHFKKTKERVEINISDQGNGFDWQPYMEFDVKRLLDSHGRGIAIAKNISFDHIEYSSKGSEVFAYLNAS